MRGLVALLEEYGDDIESDLTALYGIDLIDVWRGEVPVRRVLVLIERLVDEPTSRLRATAVGGPQFNGWGDDRELLAQLVDAINFGFHNTQRALGAKPKKPNPVPRPETKAREVLVESIDDFPIFQVMAITAT